MKFDLKRFKQTKWQPRQEAVEVPDLRDFFTGLKEGEVPAFVVRGLNGKELGAASEAATKGKDVAAVVAAIAGGTSKEKAKEVLDLLGLGGDTPPDIAKRLHHLVAGSVEPKLEMDGALAICKAFPVEFYALTNKIHVLTGQGHLPGKPPASGGEAT